MGLSVYFLSHFTPYINDIFYMEDLYMASKRLANKIKWLQDLPVYEKYVKPDINTYDAIENHDTITYYDDGQENEFNIPNAFEDHNLKYCFMGKESTNRFLLQDRVRIIYSEINSSSLKSTVSRFTKNPNNIISRLTDDISYKKDQKDVITSAQVQYSAAYSKGDDPTIMALVKDSYKSDPEEPEKLVKKSTEVVNIDHCNNMGFWDAYDTIVLNTVNAAGDIVQGKSKYMYTIDNEFIRVDFDGAGCSNESAQFIMPRLEKYVNHPTEFSVSYSRIAYPDTVYMKEYYSITDDSLAQIYKIESGPMVTNFFYNEKTGTYSYDTTSSHKTIGKNREYKIIGEIDVPISSAYFKTDLDKYGIPKMSPAQFLDSTFIFDLTGHYYRTHSRINSVYINDRMVYDFKYDKYGMIENQVYYQDDKPVDVCHYNKKQLIDDDGNYIGTYVESIVDSNPFAKRTTGEYFYRAIFVKDGVISEDYRAILKFSDD